MSTFFLFFSLVLACAPTTGAPGDDDASTTDDTGADCSQPEICDGVDNDCDGLVDDADDSVTDATTWYGDGDGDGFGIDASSGVACEQPAGASAESGDCDDADEAVFPGADEICNGIDDDCDGLVDGADDSVDGASTWCADDDRDGYGNPDDCLVACERPTGYIDDDTDCDDTDPAAGGGGAEICDDIDNDCDGLVDGSDPSVTGTATWYADDDRDGYGDPDDSIEACDRPTGYIADDSDCDDSDPERGGPEVCDDVDNDCDGLTDGQDDSLEGGSVWYRDADGDGLGDPSTTLFACSEHSGWVGNANDCDDTDADSGSCGGGDDGTICASLMGTDDGEVPVFTGSCDTSSGFVSYGSHCYYAVESSGNWPDARASCRVAGGYLATIGDSAENTFIQSLNSRPHVGGCDGDTEGAWTWITGEAFDYTSWSTGEPNDMSGEDCLENAYSGAMWNDIWCSSNPYTDGYVCEFEP